MPEWIKLLLLIIFCAGGTYFMYGIWLLENDKDEFRKKHGYKPKYHDWTKSDEDKDQ